MRKLRIAEAMRVAKRFTEEPGLAEGLPQHRMTSHEGILWVSSYGSGVTLFVWNDKILSHRLRSSMCTSDPNYLYCLPFMTDRLIKHVHRLESDDLWPR